MANCVWVPPAEKSSRTQLNPLFCLFSCVKHDSFATNQEKHATSVCVFTSQVCFRGQDSDFCTTPVVREAYYDFTGHIGLT